MRVIVMKVSLKADWAHSLKEKRMVVKSIIAKLQNKFNISVGEIENQDIHNLITIGIAGIALDAKVCDSTIENIINYIEEITDAEIINAAKLANAHDFIMKQADKYQTMIIGNGHNLSGGEKQRIAMARAIIKNSPIIILDEATSALDNESEFLIQDTITKLKKTKTIIMIAHKQATIDFADIVIEL